MGFSLWSLAQSWVSGLLNEDQPSECFIPFTINQTIHEHPPQQWISLNFSAYTCVCGRVKRRNTSTGRVEISGHRDRRSVAQGGVQHPLSLAGLGAPVLRERRDGSGLGCCWNPWRSREGSGSCPCPQPHRPPRRATAERTRQDLSLTGHLWLSSLICRALFRGALGSMWFYVSNRVLKVMQGVVCRARTRVSFLRRLLAMSSFLELLATFNQW